MVPLRDDDGGKRFVPTLGNAGKRKKQNEGIGITMVPIDFFGVEAGCFGVLKSTVNATNAANAKVGKEMLAVAKAKVMQNKKKVAWQKAKLSSKRKLKKAQKAMTKSKIESKVTISKAKADFKSCKDQKNKEVALEALNMVRETQKRKLAASKDHRRAIQETNKRLIKKLREEFVSFKAVTKATEKIISKKQVGMRFSTQAKEALKAIDISPGLKV